MEYWISILSSRHKSMITHTSHTYIHTHTHTFIFIHTHKPLHKWKLKDQNQTWAPRIAHRPHNIKPLQFVDQIHTKSHSSDVSFFLSFFFLSLSIYSLDLASYHHILGLYLIVFIIYLYNLNNDTFKHILHIHIYISTHKWTSTRSA